MVEAFCEKYVECDVKIALFYAELLILRTGFDRLAGIEIYYFYNFFFQAISVAFSRFIYVLWKYRVS